MIRLLRTAKSNYDIEKLDNDDIVIDTKENIIIINKEKHAFMNISDEIDLNAEASSNIAISQKGVKQYIIDTEETYTESAVALKIENAEIKALLG